ncbi:hypothetical protein PsorP6_012930 [Peronosclerospora sorghi]|uniref:Uncharacterized protein n=1 Tax=Peronosclerospora sorghi TaxID=230839 RepID=A0ACC0WIG9_9STRA|nr:hypothetical protein PsorP6_012930 [Peronosclerospora sorghi]
MCFSLLREFSRQDLPIPEGLYRSLVALGIDVGVLERTLHVAYNMECDGWRLSSQLLHDLMMHSRRCPQWEQRQMMRVYVRMKFRDEINTQDPDRIRALLANGKEEVERMNYYHSVYKAKRKAERAAPIGGSVHGKHTDKFQGLNCLQCDAAYPLEHANFCANCGTKRLLTK